MALQITWALVTSEIMSYSRKTACSVTWETIKIKPKPSLHSCSKAPFTYWFLTNSKPIFSSTHRHSISLQFALRFLSSLCSVTAPPQTPKTRPNNLHSSPNPSAKTAANLSLLSSFPVCRYFKGRKSISFFFFFFPTVKIDLQLTLS